MENSKTYYGGIFLNKEDLKDSKMKNKVELEYYSTKKRNNLNEEKSIYGIEIVKKEYKRSYFLEVLSKLVTEESQEESSRNKRRIVNVETNSIDNICSNSNKINEIIDLLKRNTVTPNGLHVTIEELLKQGIAE